MNSTAIKKAKKPPREPKPWKPSRNQLAVLRLAISFPELRGYRSLAKASGLHYNTVKAWRQDPRFVAWWNRELLAAAREYLGPAMGELVRIIANVNTTDSVKVKACKVFFEGLEKDVGPAEATTAVLLEAFGPQSQAAIAMTQGGKTSEIRIALRTGPGATDDLEKGQACGAVEVTRHPEHAAKLALKVVEAATEEEHRTRAESAGRRTRGPSTVEALVPRIVGSRERPSTSEDEDHDE